MMKHPNIQDCAFSGVAIRLCRSYPGYFDEAYEVALGINDPDVRECYLRKISNRVL